MPSLFCSFCDASSPICTPGKYARHMHLKIQDRLFYSSFILRPKKIEEDYAEGL